MASPSTQPTRSFRPTEAELAKLADQLEKGKPMTTVTMQELVERINRELASRSQKLIKTDAEHFDQSVLGDYFIKDLKTSHPIEWPVDPVQVGRLLGVLHEMERVK